MTKPIISAPAGISWASDRRGCRRPMWSHTQRPTHVYCDAPRESPCSPYCAAHAAVAYTRDRANAA